MRATSSPPADLAGADLVLSIEAFVHGSDPAAYFRAAAGLLRAGGLLVVCDDVLTALGAWPSAQGAAQLAAFRSGWRIASLLTVEQVLALAEAAGLEPVRDDDLTPYLDLRRPRDRALAVLVAAARPLPLRGEYWASLVGGRPPALPRQRAPGVPAARAPARRSLTAPSVDLIHERLVSVPA